MHGWVRRLLRGAEVWRHRFYLTRDTRWIVSSLAARLVQPCVELAYETTFFFPVYYRFGSNGTNGTLCFCSAQLELLR